MNGKLQTVLATLILAMLGWLAVEIRELRVEIRQLRTDMREEHAAFDSRLDRLDTRLDRVEQNVAVLMERTKVLEPAVPKGKK